MNNSQHTLKKMLLSAAEKSEESGKGITFYQENGEKKLTYRQLWEVSLEVAGGLQKAGIAKGSFVVLQIKEPEQFLKGFWGTLIYGAIPVPLTVNDKKGLDVQKLKNVTKIMDNFIILTEACYVKSMREKYSFKEKILLVEEIRDAYEGNPEQIESEEQSAYVQFSSGSTSSPKGVCLTHRNIISNIRGMMERMGGKRALKEEVVMNWLPLTHNMGLVGLHLMPMYAEMEQHIMTPSFLLQHMNKVLEMIKTENVTILSCPNFLIRLLLAKIDGQAIKNLDFSKIRSIHMGAEPINPHLVRKFITQMQSYGLRPDTIACGYGMAESALIVSHQYRGEGLKTIWHKGKEVVLNGQPLEGTVVYTVDEEENKLEEGMVGELVVQSESIMKGYLNIKEDNSLSEQGLKTGDIGMVTGEGIAVLGRKKDMIIINAKNYYITDIEGEIEQKTGIPAENFVLTSILDSQSNEQVQLYFLRQAYHKDPESCRAAEAAFESYTGSKLAEIYLVEEIPRTVSGKKQRFQVKQMKEKERLGDSKIQEEALPENETERKIAYIWEQVLHTRIRDIHTSFFKLGGDSLSVMDCIVQLKKENILVTPEYFYDHPTIADLAGLAKKGGILVPTEQMIVTGEVDPLPSRFMLMKKLYRNHWNFSMLFDIEPFPPKEVLEKIIEALLRQHDGLRHRFERNQDTVREWIEGVEKSIWVEQLYYEDEKELRYYLDAFQSTLELKTCPLKFVLLKRKEGEDGKLLVLCHHALGDAYSMKLFLNDFLEIYDMVAVQGKKVIPKLKTTSLKQWGNIVNQFAKSEACAADISYWRKVSQCKMEIPLDFQWRSWNNRIVYEKVYSFRLTDLNQSQENEEIQFKLLAAWLKTLAVWTGSEQVNIMYTCNGRAGISTVTPYNLSYTIGWMAFLVPISVNIPKQKTLKELIRLVKNEINSIPHGGISYGCLKYLVGDKELIKTPVPNVSFNYYAINTQRELYQNQGHRIAQAKEELRMLEHPAKERDHLIDLVIHKTEQNELYAKIHYSCNIHKEKTIQHLAAQFQQNVALLFKDEVF